MHADRPNRERAEVSPSAHHRILRETPRVMPVSLSHRLPCLAGICALFLGMGAISSHAAGPDQVILKNGRELQGLIIRRDAESVTLQREDGSETIDLRLIRRIDDTRTTSAYFAAASQPLPPWEAIVNDLRANEEIRRLRLVSSEREIHGNAAGWTYRRFEMNDSMELRVYGNPENPAGIEIGLRGSAASDRRERQKVRSFLAGFLTERRQIAALYLVDMNGGERTAGNLRFRFATQGDDGDRPDWSLQVWNVEARRDGAAPRTSPPAGWDHGFERDRDGNLRSVSDPRLATAGH